MRESWHLLHTPQSTTRTVVDLHRIVTRLGLHIARTHHDINLHLKAGCDALRALADAKAAATLSAAEAVATTVQRLASRDTCTSYACAAMGIRMQEFADAERKHASQHVSVLRQQTHKTNAALLSTCSMCSGLLQLCCAHTAVTFTWCAVPKSKAIQQSCRCLHAPVTISAVHCAGDSAKAAEAPHAKGCSAGEQRTFGAARERRVNSATMSMGGGRAPA
jgi:hypothetical protein